MKDKTQERHFSNLIELLVFREMADIKHEKITRNR